MEVLMNRNTSRIFIVILGLVLVGGAVLYVRHQHLQPAVSMGTDKARIPNTLPPPAPLAPPATLPGRETDPRGGIPTTIPATPLAPSSPTVTTGGDPWMQLLGSAATGVSGTAPTSANPLAEGRAKIADGQLLAGRRILNDALNSGVLSGEDAAKAMALIAEANNTLVFSGTRSADDPYAGGYQVKAGDNLTKIAATHGVTADFLLRINGMSDARKLRAGTTIKTVAGPFHAVVTKGKFTMDLYLGGLPGEKSALYVTTFPVGLGKNDSTPAGSWLVDPQHKLTNPTYYSPRGEGVIDAGDPKNPLGKFWIGLIGTESATASKASYGIHGTIDPASIGKQESMGCIRMRNEDVALVYEMLVEGKSAVLVKN